MHGRVLVLLPNHRLPEEMLRVHLPWGQMLPLWNIRVVLVSGWCSVKPRCMRMSTVAESDEVRRSPLALVVATAGVVAIASAPVALQGTPHALGAVVVALGIIVGLTSAASV